MRLMIWSSNPTGRFLNFWPWWCRCVMEISIQAFVVMVPDPDLICRVVSHRVFRHIKMWLDAFTDWCNVGMATNQVIKTLNMISTGMYLPSAVSRKVRNFCHSLASFGHIPFMEIAYCQHRFYEFDLWKFRNDYFRGPCYPKWRAFQSPLCPGFVS